MSEGEREGRKRSCVILSERELIAGDSEEEEWGERGAEWGGEGRGDRLKERKMVTMNRNYGKMTTMILKSW